MHNSSTIRYDDLHWKTDRQAASLFIYLFSSSTSNDIEVQAMA